LCFASYVVLQAAVIFVMLHYDCNSFVSFIQALCVFLTLFLWLIVNSFCVAIYTVLFYCSPWYLVGQCRSLSGSTHALVQDPIRSWLNEQLLRDCCRCWVTLAQQPRPLNLLSRQAILTRIWTKVGRYDSFHCRKIEFWSFTVQPWHKPHF
jgi:hypothetical protein